MSFPTSQDSNYRVEVSGWDSRENFFVEKTILDWGNEGKKEITIRTTLRKGCIVFVLLLQSISDKNNFPIAYQTVVVGSKDGNGQMRVTLEQLRPRTGLEEAIGPAGSTTVRVA
jgi:hypothetical protein